MPNVLTIREAVQRAKLMDCLLRNTAYVDGSEQEQSRHGRLDKRL